MRRLENVALALVMITLSGCATTERYVWVRDYSAPPPTVKPEVIAPGDLVTVHVWNSEQMTSHQRVRGDGTISLFFVDDVRIADLTPADAAREVAKHLTDIVQSPRVNVVLEESASATVSVLGEVGRPGSYPVLSAPTLLRAFAAAQGLTEYAHRDRIFVLRQTPAPTRIRVSYDELARGDAAAAGFSLRSGDVVIVE